MPHPYLPRSTRKTLLHSRRTSSSVHLHKTILFHNHCWFVRLGGRSRPCILRRRTHTSSYRHRHQHLSLDHNDTPQFASLSKQTKESLTQQYLWQISWESPYGPSFQCFNYERQRGRVRLQNSPYFCVFKCARKVRRVRQAHFALRYAKPILRKKPDCFAVYSRVVSESDSQSGSTRFESCFDHLLDLLSGRSECKSSATPVNNQLVASCQMAFLILLCSIWIICF